MENGNLITLLDFDSSHLFGSLIHKFFPHRCGTPEFQSPELVNFEDYGKPVDIWALGVIAYVLLEGKLPFDSPNTMKLFSLIRAADYKWSETLKTTFSQNSLKFVDGCLSLDPKKRPTAAQAERHGWFSDSAEKISQNTLRGFKKNVEKYNEQRIEKEQQMHEISESTKHLRKSLMLENLQIFEPPPESPKEKSPSKQTVSSTSQTKQGPLISQDSSSGLTKTLSSHQLKGYVLNLMLNFDLLIYVFFFNSSIDAKFSKHFKNFPGFLAVPNRFFIFSQEMLTKRTSKDKFSRKWVHLFNDILIYSKKDNSLFGKNSQFVVKGVVPLHVVELQMLDRLVNQKNYYGFQLQSHLSSKNWTFALREYDDAQKWVKLLNSCLDVYRKRPKSSFIGTAFGNFFFFS